MLAAHLKGVSGTSSCLMFTLLLLPGLGLHCSGRRGSAGLRRGRDRRTARANNGGGEHSHVGRIRRCRYDGMARWVTLLCCFRITHGSKCEYDVMLWSVLNHTIWNIFEFCRPHRSAGRHPITSGRPTPGHFSVVII